MPRLDSWIKTRVMTFIKPRPHKKLTTKDLKISNPISTSLQHWTPVMPSPPQPRSRWSVSAEDLLLSDMPSLTHSRESSNSSGITIVVHSPPPSTPPPDFFPVELPLLTRRMWSEAPKPTIILPESPPMETVLFSETPSPTSYFKSAFEFDIKDLMLSADSVLSETDSTDVQCMSYMVEQRPRLTRRMSLGIDGLRPSTWEYNRI